MNLVLRIFAVYFIVLSFLPCGDANECAETLKSKFTVISIPQHATHSDHDENCPPLCNCSCCSAHFLQDNQAIKINALTFSFRQVFAEPSSSLSATDRSIWQPPQLL